MMILNRSHEYAFLALGLLAASTAPLDAATLAARLAVPAPYLAKVLQHLAKAGVLRSIRGKRGGYLLARPAERITVLEIIRAVDGPQAAPVFASSLFHDLNRRLENYLERETVAGMSAA